MNLILFGPPGSGKGTQAALLVERLRFRHLSTGEMLRKVVRDGAPIGLRVKEIVGRGELVPDLIVTTLVRDAIRENGREKRQYIFDGYPRTLGQVNDLDAILREADLPKAMAIALLVDEEEVVRRLSGRRQCRRCGAVYNIPAQPPRRDGVCDVCGGEIVQRSDDNPATVRERLRVYEKETRPVMDAYAVAGQLLEVSASGSPEEVYGRLVGVLEGQGA